MLFLSNKFIIIKKYNITLNQNDYFINKNYAILYYLSMMDIALDLATDFADLIHPNDKSMYKYADAYISKIKELQDVNNHSIDIYDITGKRIFSKELNENRFTYKNLSEGVYFINVKRTGKFYSLKR